MTAEQQQAIIDKVIKEFGPDGGYARVAETLGVLKVNGERIEVDLKAVKESVEKQGAAIDRFQSQIRTHRGPGYVPGMEDYAKRFSPTRAFSAIAHNDWSKAGLEKELIDQSLKRVPSAMVGNEASGGAFIADNLMADVIEPVYRKSRFIALNPDDGETNVSVIDGLTLGQATIPGFVGGCIAYFHREAEEPTASKVKTFKRTMMPKKCSVLVQLTEEMTSYAMPVFDRLLNKDMAKALSRKIDHTIPYGFGGESAPRGIVRTPGIRIYSAESKGNGVLLDPILGVLGAAPFQADWVGAELHPDHFSNMKLVLAENEEDTMDAMAIMPPRAVEWLKQLKALNFSGQTTGMPYLLPFGMTDAQLTNLIGKFAATTQIPSNLKPGASIGAPSASGTAKCGDIFYGDMSEVLVGRAGGMIVKRDNGLGAGIGAGTEIIRVTTYIDTTVRRPEAILVCPDGKIRA